MSRPVVYFGILLLIGALGRLVGSQLVNSPPLPDYLFEVGKNSDPPEQSGRLVLQPGDVFWVALTPARPVASPVAVTVVAHQPGQPLRRWGLEFTSAPDGVLKFRSPVEALPPLADGHWGVLFYLSLLTTGSSAPADQSGPNGLSFGPHATLLDEMFELNIAGAAARSADAR